MYPTFKIRTPGKILSAKAYVPYAPYNSVYEIFNYLMWVVIETEEGEVIQAYPSSLSGTTGWQEQGVHHLLCDGDATFVPTLGPIAESSGVIRISKGDGYTNLSRITIAGASAVKDSNGVMQRPFHTGGWTSASGDLAGRLIDSWHPDADTDYTQNFGSAWYGGVSSPANGKVTCTFKTSGYTMSFFGSGSRQAWDVSCSLDLSGATPRFLLESVQTKNQYLDNPGQWMHAVWFNSTLGSNSFYVEAHALPLHPDVLLQADVPSIMGVISDSIAATAEVPGQLENRANFKALESYREIHSNTTENAVQLMHASRLLPIDAAFRFAAVVSSGAFRLRKLKQVLVKSLARHNGRITAPMCKTSLTNSALLTADLLLACQKLASSLYLWWRYVANTSVEDAKEWHTLSAKSRESGRITVSDWQKEVDHTIGAMFQPRGYRLRGSAGGESSVNGQQASHLVSVVAKVRPFEAAEFLLKPLRLGLNVGYGTTWDLIPLSFVVDWFTGIGDTLRGVDWLFYRHLLGLQAHIVTTRSDSVPVLPPGWTGGGRIRRFTRRISFVWPSFLDSIPIPRMIPFEKWKYAALALATS